MNLSKFDGKKVFVIDTDNKKNEGLVNLYIPAKDNDIDEDCIGLDNGMGFYESDIKSIEEI